MSDKTITLKGASVTVPQVTPENKGQVEVSWRKTTEIVARTIGAQQYIETTGEAVAPLYLVLGQEIENAIRENRKELGVEDDADARRMCMEQFDAHIKEELEYLRKAEDWKAKKLPQAGDKAMRRVRNVWKNGGWTLDMVSVSACDKFTAAKAKEIQAKIDKKTGQSAPDLGTDDFGFASPELKAELAEFFKLVEAAAMKNGQATLDSMRAQNGRLRNIAGVAKAAVSAASKSEESAAA